MTTLDIDAIRKRARLAAATRKSWASELGRDLYIITGLRRAKEIVVDDVPALCDEVERLRAAAELDGPWKAFLVHEGYVENLSELNDDDEVTVTVVRDSAMPDDEGRMPGTYTSSDVAFEITDLYVDGEGDPAMAAVAVLARARAMAAGLNTAELAEAATR